MSSAVRARCLFASIALLAWGAPASASEAGTPPEGVYRRTFVTSEGAKLTLFRYVPVGGGVRSPAVLLVSDFGFGREVFDLDGEGLSRFLRDHGREVFVLERGTDGARGVLDFLRHELPAAFEEVARFRTGAVDLVAHGFAGTLALAATTEELGGRVRSVIALSTPVELELPNPRVAAVLEGGGRLTALASHRGGQQTLDLLFARRGTFSRGVRSALWSRGLRELGGKTSSELLGWMRQGDLVGAPSIDARWARYDRPTLLVLPLADNYAHPEYAAVLRERAPRAKVTLLPLSRVELLSEDYTHLSMLLGKSARKEVWSPMLRFLQAQDRDGSGQTVEASR